MSFFFFFFLWQNGETMLLYTGLYRQYKHIATLLPQMTAGQQAL